MVEVKDAIRAMTIAKKALEERHRYTEVSLTMKCPICDNGVLICSMSVGNKHTSGSCTTTGCVSWIE